MAILPEDWERIKKLFDGAMERGAESRLAYLQEQAVEPCVTEGVLEILAEYDKTSSFLSEPSYHEPANRGQERLISGTLLDGKFKVLQLIAEGGMGEVWLAEQIKPIHRKVALKLIKTGMDTKTVVARFESERQALAMMDHPNIARVYDAGSTATGRPYFVMEYVPGLRITDYCDKHQLSVNARLALFLQVCEGVQHAHQKAIIHRDLKPSNVLVIEQDKKAVPKIIDFGLAKATWGRLTDKTMFTGFGVMMGTPEYMSPEQADQHEHNIDTRTDVYSLGVILYELLTGTLPFDLKEWRKQPLHEVLRQIREVDPSRPSLKLFHNQESATSSAALRGIEPRVLLKLLEGDLDWITMMALEKNLERRYDSPASLAADIRRYLTNQPVLASPPSVSYRAGKFVKRNRLGVLTAAALFLMLIALVISMEVENIHITNADANRRQALGTADKILSSIGRLGSTSIRPDDMRLSIFQKDLLKQMALFYTSTAMQNPTDEEIGRDAARARYSLGDINRLLEKYGEAVEEYRDAIHRFEALEKAHPEKREYRQAQAYAHNYLGETLRLWSSESRMQPPQAARADAAAEYDRAIRLQQALRAEDPQNAKYQQESARTYYNRGILRFYEKDLNGSKSDFDESINLLEPLVNGKTDSQTWADDPPAHDLARAYNNLGVLLRDEKQVEKAQVCSKRAIELMERLVRRDPDSNDYGVELATFYNNLAFSLTELGADELAREQNHEALDTIEDLATPPPSMEYQRAKAHMLRLYLGASPHPEFHALFKHLGDEYANLASEYLKSGNADAARLAVRALGDVLPKIAEPDRTRLSKSYQELRATLQESKNSYK